MPKIGKRWFLVVSIAIIVIIGSSCTQGNAQNTEPKIETGSQNRLELVATATECKSCRPSLFVYINKIEGHIVYMNRRGEMIIRDIKK